MVLPFVCIFQTEIILLKGYLRAKTCSERNNPPSYLFLPVLLVIIGGILKLLGIILFRIINSWELIYSA